MTLDEENFQQYIIAAGVELAAPTYGTSVLALKSWMRGETECPPEALARWIAAPRQPPGKGELEAHIAAMSPLGPPAPAPMQVSALSARVLADPAIQARLKADRASPAAEPESPGPERSLGELFGLSPQPVQEPREPENEVVVHPEPATNGEGPAFVIDEAAGRYSIYPARIKTSVSVLMPTIRDIPPAIYFGHIVFFRKYELGLEMQTDTLLVRARNLVARRFLASKAQWSWWLDSDILPPVGNADWFKKKTRTETLGATQSGYDALERLLSHNYPIVGAVYAARTAHAQMIIQPDIDPRSRDDPITADKIRKGQLHGLINVEWLGLGCTLIHRRVFEAIAKQSAPDPDRRAGELDFFHTEGSKGEDVGFCERATLAGFKPKLDCDLVVGHLGRHCFLPEHTRGIQARK